MALLTLLSWWPLSPWLSPAAAWFIFFNVVVGAIAVMSTTSAQAGQAGATPTPRRRLCRSGSSSMVLDRLRSFFTFPVGQLPIDETHWCSIEAAEAAAAYATPVTICAPERKARAVAVSATAQPSAPVAVATVEDHAPPAAPPPPEDEQEDHEESISLDEAYALAQRHRVKPPASSPPAGIAVAASATAAPAALPTEHEKKPAKAVADGKAEEEVLEGKAELNARAELFIRQFREELRLQRLNSILKHTHALGSPTAAR